MMLQRNRYQRRTLIPDETASEEQSLRARHQDLDDLAPADVWAELILLRPHLARLLFQRQRRLCIVRTDHGVLVDEREWATERIERLERLLARRGRAA